MSQPDRATIILAAIAGSVVFYGIVGAAMLGAGIQMFDMTPGVRSGIFIAGAVIVATVPLLGRVLKNADSGSGPATTIVLFAMAEIPALMGLLLALSGDLVGLVAGLVASLGLMAAHYPRSNR